MSRYVFKMPDLGEGTVTAEVVEWKVKVGDMVEEDQVIAEVMTDKAAVEIPSPVTGRVRPWRCQLTGGHVAAGASGGASCDQRGSSPAGHSPDSSPAAWAKAATSRAKGLKARSAAMAPV